jgi:hypothetical protein
MSEVVDSLAEDCRLAIYLTLMHVLLAQAAPERRSLL